MSTRPQAITITTNTTTQFPRVPHSKQGCTLEISGTPDSATMQLGYIDETNAAFVAKTESESTMTTTPIGVTYLGGAGRIPALKTTGGGGSLDIDVEIAYI